jgi:hypothetical protein
LLSNRVLTDKLLFSRLPVRKAVVPTLSFGIVGP